MGLGSEHVTKTKYCVDGCGQLQQGGLMHCVVQVFAWLDIMVVMFMDLPEKSCLGDQQGLQEPLCYSPSTTSVKTLPNKDQTSVQR